MSKIGSEIKVGLESPLIVGLKLVKQCCRHSSRNVREAGCVDGVGSEQDAEKDRWFAVRVRSNRESDIPDFPCIKHRCGLSYGIFELCLVDETDRNRHSLLSRARFKSAMTGLMRERAATKN
jgi:hypothetical protein